MAYTVDALIIDVETLDEKIFPAFRNGEEDPLIMEIIQNLIEDEKVCMMEWDAPQYTHRYKGLRSVFETFNSEMTSSSLGNTFTVKDGIIKINESRFNLPVQSDWGYEQLTDLMEYAIIKYSAKYYGNLGSPYKIENLFEPDIGNQINKFNEAIEILSKLENYSQYYIHGNGGYGEGISGWLNSNEVQEVYSILCNLNLNELQKLPSYRGLITLLSIIELASRENKGMLIGRDLRMTVINRYAGNVTKLLLSEHVSGDGCVNFTGNRIA